MRVLVACEFSGIVREAFAKLGHDAWSCDLLPTEIPGKHFQGRVQDFLFERDGRLATPWDLLIAHPPCTRLANSGVCWLRKRELWGDLEEAARFFRLLMNAPIKRVAVENPIPHKYALEIIGRKYDQIIQPWQFGHPESKATCLWLKNLPPLQPTNIVKEEMMKLPIAQRQRNHWIPPGEDRWKERSRTYQGVADAMAAQWSEVLDE